MPRETIAFDALEDVRDFASSGGKFLVLDPETLQQIEDAEAQGGFEGDSQATPVAHPLQA
jgi:hypothetical protein